MKLFLTKIDCGSRWLWPQFLRQFGTLFLCVESSWCRQWLCWNNLLSSAHINSSILKVWQQNHRLKASWNRLSMWTLSPLDNCPAKDGRAEVTTDSTTAVNITWTWTDFKPKVRLRLQDVMGDILTVYLEMNWEKIYILLIKRAQ